MLEENQLLIEAHFVWINILLNFHGTTFLYLTIIDLIPVFVLSN
jgi:hypothetical protein